MKKKTYAQYCGLAKALDVVGERWTLLIIRNLVLGPMRYNELHKNLPGITTNLLAKRLKEMEEANLIEKTRFSSSNSSFGYRLTADGKALEPALQALAAWGGRRMGQWTPEQERRFDWFLVSIKRRYQGGLNLEVELIADDVPYHFLLSGADIDIQRRSASNPALRIRASSESLFGLLLKGWPANSLPEDLSWEGDKKALRQFFQAFLR